ncbi:hypothetical protein H2200_011818 [Cladophialophora chaetospira]|uniref:MARVEL domain-containing protein n=1 Tax=Cladophialophora chaetospira TaxID=386627 RepID=A0AA38WYV2_9EURO|nr:hypothetical protein H2200_011818 [Cladophialophora chaetospira]
MASFYNKIRASRPFQSLMRVIQFLSSIISLGLFSARLYKIMRTVQRASASNGAVEGILAAAVAYTLISMLMKFLLKGGAKNWLRWLWIVFDILFVGGFIAVAVLTKPNGGTSGPCNKRIRNRLPNGTNCNLPWGTFILAIVSTLLHAITAIFNEARDHHRKNKAERAHHEKNVDNERGHLF